MPVPSQLNNQLKERRFHHGQITQKDLAENLGVSRQTMHAIETGKFNPSVKLALAIAAFFECRVEENFQLEVDQ